MAIAFQLCSNTQWEIDVSCSIVMFGMYYRFVCWCKCMSGDRSVKPKSVYY